MDTETLLALLSSLLHPLEFDQASLLDALANSQGDIEGAASLLRSEPPRKRRKVSSKNTKKAGLDGWLKGKDRDESDLKTTQHESASSCSPRTNQATPSKISVTSPSKPGSESKQVSNSEFMALLRPPNPVDNSKAQVAKHRPLMLVSPEHIAEHTPCTLHNSILPPELACRCVNHHPMLCPFLNAWYRLS